MPEMILNPIQELSAWCSLPHYCLLTKARVVTDYPKTRCSTLEVSLDLLAHFPIISHHLNCSSTKLLADPMITAHRGVSGTEL